MSQLMTLSEAIKRAREIGSNEIKRNGTMLYLSDGCVHLDKDLNMLASFNSVSTLSEPIWEVVEPLVEGWINVYADGTYGGLHKTKPQAESVIRDGRFKCVFVREVRADEGER